MLFTLEELPYAYDALEPYIDAPTMKVHHDKHHQGYTDKLNAALEGRDELAGKSAEELLTDLAGVPDDIREAVRNSGGGYVNHNLFWEIMSPASGEPSGELAEALKKSFGGTDKFKEKFTEVATGFFGSGWVWLVRNSGGELEIVTTANQDTPLSDGATPLLTIDVWEHAYYLKYKNRRPEYIEAWWQVVNWEEVGKRLEKKEM